MATNRERKRAYHQRMMNAGPYATHLPPMWMTNGHNTYPPPFQPNPYSMQYPPYTPAPYFYPPQGNGYPGQGMQPVFLPTQPYYPPQLGFPPALPSRQQQPVGFATQAVEVQGSAANQANQEYPAVLRNLDERLQLLERGQAVHVTPLRPHQPASPRLPSRPAQAVTEHTTVIVSSGGQRILSNAQPAAQPERPAQQSGTAPPAAVPDQSTTDTQQSATLPAASKVTTDTGARVQPVEEPQKMEPYTRAEAHPVTRTEHSVHPTLPAGSEVIADTAAKELPVDEEPPMELDAQADEPPVTTDEFDAVRKARDTSEAEDVKDKFNAYYDALLQNSEVAKLSYGMFIDRCAGREARPLGQLSIEISIMDLITLLPGRMLNDQIIHGVISILATGRPEIAIIESLSIKAYSTNPTTRIARQLHKRIKVDTRTIIIPICDTAHWLLAIANLTEDDCNILFYDSLSFDADRISSAKATITSLFTAMQAIQGSPLSKLSIKTKTVRMPRAVRQKNGFDCGVFLLEYVRTVLNGEELPFRVDSDALRIEFTKLIVAVSDRSLQPDPIREVPDSQDSPQEEVFMSDVGSNRGSSPAQQHSTGIARDPSPVLGNSLRANYRRICSNCGARGTYCGRDLCQNCVQYETKHGKPRPQELQEQLLLKRKRQSSGSTARGWGKRRSIGESSSDDSPVPPKSLPLPPGTLRASRTTRKPDPNYNMSVHPQDCACSPDGDARHCHSHQSADDSSYPSDDSGHDDVDNSEPLSGDDSVMGEDDAVTDSNQNPDEKVVKKKKRPPNACLESILDAWHDPKFRQKAKREVYLLLQQIYPGLQPWNGSPDATIFTVNDEATVREHLTRCLPPGLLGGYARLEETRTGNRQKRKSTRWWCRHDQREEHVWIPMQVFILVGCNLLTEEQWTDYYQKGYHVSHLCHNDWCRNPFHIVIEFSRDNQARKSCHTENRKRLTRCKCRGKVPCLVAEINASLDDRWTTMNRLVTENLAVYQNCPIPGCDFSFKISNDGARHAQRYRYQLNKHLMEHHKDVF